MSHRLPAILLLWFCASVATAQTARLFPVDLSVPFAPTAFSSAGKTNIVYELHVDSYRAGDLDWDRLAVLDAAGNELKTWEGASLEQILTRPASALAPKERRRIGAGMQAVAFIWLALDGPPPSPLRHRVTFTIPASSRKLDRIVEGAAIAVKPSAMVIGPPMRGGSWVVRHNDNNSFHRRSLFPVDGHAGIAQRFAIDWNRFDEEGYEYRHEGKRNDDYSVYGQELIAVAEAEVARVVNGVPENEPGSISPAATLDPESATGNAVVLRLADGTFATYAHLQAGSIKVREGQRVRRGDILGLAGNSGNSTGPHLHFHISTGPLLTGEGVPYVIDSFELLGTGPGPTEDARWRGRGESKPERRRGEMPAERMVVAF
jgi:murein DD-endopeptidase MepM/ murein hydrolase activator NlpD